MADRPTINSRAFRTEFIRLTEPTAVTALGRVIGVWHPVSVAIDSRMLDGIRPGEPFATTPFHVPAPRSAVPVTPAVDVPPKDVESKGVDDVRTQGQRTGAPDLGSPVPAVEAGGGGIHATGGHLDPAPQRRKSQAARDKILKAVNRGNMP